MTEILYSARTLIRRSCRCHTRADAEGHAIMDEQRLRVAFAPAVETVNEDEGPRQTPVELSSAIDAEDERQMLYVTRFAGPA